MDKFYWCEYEDKDGDVMKDITWASDENRVRELWSKNPKGKLLNVVELIEEEIEKNVIIVERR